MNNLDPNQILNNLLQFINNESRKTLRPYFSDGELCKLVEEDKPNLDGYESPNNADEIIRMLDKLEKDNYLSSELMPQSEPVEKRTKYYKITFDGRFFLKNGGYVREYADQNSKEERIRKNEKQIHDLTVLLAIGSIGLLVIEIIKFFADYFPSTY